MLPLNCSKNNLYTIFWSVFTGTAQINGSAMEPTDQGQSSVVMVTPDLPTKVSGDESPPPKVRCPCGVHEVRECVYCQFTICRFLSPSFPLSLSLPPSLSMHMPPNLFFSVSTVFPRSDAAATIYFIARFCAATI